ncbi:non-ribosomal peptide synthetase [Actinokineospora diospyrosa]|uniref:Amino acid adenylation domain-containing protein n=1 Tax=Actinokineospora diospyrosa TaxID=103728 RepID=A0ABT1IG30_9PSEU|nr:amino acid adenylation domain-containing protein [Actinokineospora diospyrosa]MCP2271575.1 amino acid adenylation domain-containing protein [Actinokineospora diospyrosa]
MTTPHEGFTDWTALAAEVLGVPAAEVEERARWESFTALGGTSLQAIELTARGQRSLGEDVDVARLLSAVPLAQALSGAREFTPTVPDPVEGLAHRELLPGQKAMLAAHLAGRDQPYHLMFTVRPPIALTVQRTRIVLQALTARHESLRTMFTEDGPAVRRIVLPVTHTPRLLLQSLPAGSDPVEAVHGLYGTRGPELLRPFEQPPVVFVHTRVGGEGGDVLVTVLVHHALIDGWGVGVLWRDFARLCAGEALGEGPSPEWIAARLASREASGDLESALAQVVERLEQAPLVAELPTDARRVDEADGHGARLVFQPAPAVVEGVNRLARECQATVTSVLLSAWALAVARRLGVADLVLGVPAAGRPEAGMADLVGLCTRIVPVRCRIDEGRTAGEFVRATAGAVADAVAYADLPFARVVAALADTVDATRNPVAQIGFAAHHELVPDEFDSGGTWRVHEGHCHGSVFDALLFVQSWSARPRLAIEYATSAQTAADIGELVESFQAVVEELATRPGARLADLGGLSAGQRALVAELGVGASFEPGRDDLWSRFEAQVARRPDAVAVVDGALTLTYRELKAHALAQADLLRECGVRAGDRVILEVPRSAAEAVAVMGILSARATYVAVDSSAPPGWRQQIVAAVSPAARIGGDATFAGIAQCSLADLGQVRGDLSDERPDLEPAAAYISFTSGTTGVPKGVVVPHGAVLRLADDREMFADPEGARVLRLSPLAFDASTLELLVPLVNGMAVAVYPPGEPTPNGLAEFLRSASVSHAWLTSGLFHIVADHQPAAFSGLRQVFTGGGVVSAVHVRRVLDRCPGLRVTNGYGPTENTTFTAVFHVDGPDEVLDPLPIGRPVRGTGVWVVDEHDRLVPPGAVGELRTTGWGLADEYVGDPARTAAAFTERAGNREYRTGDLVRWGADGALRFLGRADRQVKIAGHRVELVDVERRIKLRPGVLDAVVFLAGERLCAALRADADAVAEVRAAVEPELASYQRPQRWFAVGEFPLDRNGKVDLRALAELAVPTVATAPVTAGPVPDLEELICGAWVEVLGTEDFDLEEAFFDVGGDSLTLALVRRRLQEQLGGRRISLTDLYRFPTVRTLATHLRTVMTGVA